LLLGTSYILFLLAHILFVAHYSFVRYSLLPQTPYLANGGSLLEQIIYPKLLSDAVIANDRAAVDDRVRRCLADVNLLRLAETNADGLLRVHDEWDDVLSGGERQRIGFARIFFHAPDLVLLDEATSAINADEEQTLYARLIRGESGVAAGAADAAQGQGQGGATVISIAHRLELKKVHTQTLVIKGDGSGVWDLTR
jgi:ABC-type uncharacterized transport system fused permease/ATPase subunit